MNIYAIPPLLTGLILTIIGLLVFLKNKTSKLNIIFSLFSLSMVIWLFGYTNMYLSKEPSTALKWARIGFLGIIFIPVFAYHFIITFLNLKRKIILPIIYVLTIPSLLLSQTNYIYSGIKEHFWGYYPVAGRIYFVFLSMFGVLFIRGVLLLVSYLRKETGLRRNQIKYICLAFGLGTFGIVDYLVKYPIFDVYPFGYICALLFISLIAFAIVRYRLLDINLALTRVGIFVVVYTLVLGIPFWFGFRFLGKGPWIIPVSIMAVFATLGPFIYLFLQRRAEARLLAQKRARQEKLRELSSYMMRFTRLKLLSSLIVHNVLKILQLKHTALYLLEVDPNKPKQYNLISSYGLPQKLALPLGIPLDSALVRELTRTKTALELEQIKHRAAEASNNSSWHYLLEELTLLKAHIVIPTFLRFQLMGFLILGESRNQEVLTQEDISVLQVLSNQAALAIENSLFWQKEQERLIEESREDASQAVSFGAGHQFNNRLYAISMTADSFLDMAGVTIYLDSPVR